ncbi:hypothetical protein CGCSCA4_v009001 [Colletotrichum siamense]|uniref:Uncharacterized protein n=1 Tax=Colletotrichum siamense TaxID=690259 RepID=A0A9P5BS08_COLSI|nr:hypothetical protein CGCSCA2_v014936 [Colletotrichum siamense]KAF4841880.1 hypothetical protein CGCSCA4_v009001 [Colletotrichum siamense]KAF4868834.1 hypothetical protein CGCSCA1_v011973 [Colletotrichum siamense]
MASCRAVQGTVETAAKDHRRCS